MRPINFILFIFIVILISFTISCHKMQPAVQPIQYLNRIAQDTAYRFGKWYSVIPWTNQYASPYLDTIWFINDTLAGWTGFVLDSPSAYAFRKTYFADALHIVMIAPDALIPAKIDTDMFYCQMTTPNSDTFQIWWVDGLNYTPQNYVKRTK